MCVCVCVHASVYVCVHVHVQNILLLISKMVAKHLILLLFNFDFYNL